MAHEERTEIIEDRRPPPPPPPWWQENWWIWLLVLLLIVGAIIAYFALRDEIGDDDRVLVPDVVGLREAQAIRLLEERDLDVRVVRDEADEPAGEVVAQVPGAGSRVAEGQLVQITVSQGEAETETVTVTETETEATTAEEEPETVTVPDVFGGTYPDGAEEIFAAGLIADSYPVESPDPRATIVAQEPRGGVEAERGSIVRLNVSIGDGPRPPREVPDLTGPTLEEAHARCREAGFTCRTIFRTAPSAEEAGEVIDQRPAAGTTAPELSQLTLFAGR